MKISLLCLSGIEGKRISCLFATLYEESERLLFRLVNYFRPKSLIEVGIGNGASIGYMRAACHTNGFRHLERQGLDKDFSTTGGETVGGAYIRLSAL